MKSFRFPLQRVLDWRALQMRTEEEKLAALQQQLSTLIHRDTALTAAQVKSEVGLLQSSSLNGTDFRALAAFQLGIQRERASLKANRLKCEAQIVEQRMNLLKARKNCRILEKLKERRWRTWTYLTDRELENTAAEAYISKWLRTESER